MALGSVAAAAGNEQDDEQHDDEQSDRAEHLHPPWRSSYVRLPLVLVHGSEVYETTCS